MGYRTTLAATGGTPPYTWSLTSGSLPPGLILHSDGVIEGTPITAGTFPFTVQVRDNAGQTAQQQLSITVQAAAPRPAPGQVFLSDLAHQPYLWGGRLGVNQCVRTGEVMRVRGVSYSRGFSLHDSWGRGFMAFNLGGRFQRLTGFLGIDDRNNQDNMTVRLEADGRALKTFTLERINPLRRVDLNVQGVTSLVLHASGTSTLVFVVPELQGDHAAWVADMRGPQPAPGQVFLSDLAHQPYLWGGRLGVNQCVRTGEVMRVRGVSYSRGFSLHDSWGRGFMAFNLGGRFQRLTGVLGIDDRNNQDNMTVRLEADGRVLKTFTLERINPLRRVDLNVQGVTSLVLHASGTSTLVFVVPELQGDHAAWVADMRGPQPAPGQVFLSDLAHQPYLWGGRLGVNQCVRTGEVMRVRGVSYSRGFSLHDSWGRGFMAFNLGGRFQWLTGFLGIDDRNNQDTVTVRLEADGRVLKTFTLGRINSLRRVDLNVQGVTSLVLHASGTSTLVFAWPELRP